MTTANQLGYNLKEAGHSLTRSRQLVFDALIDQEPQTMQQLVTALAGQIDRASVYRTINLFEQIGIIQRLQIGWKYKLELSDSFHRHHHHMTCQSCGRIIAFKESAEFAKNLVEIVRANDFLMKGHQLEIQGLCSDCAQS